MFGSKTENGLSSDSVTSKELKLLIRKAFHDCKSDSNVTEKLVMIESCLEKAFSDTVSQLHCFIDYGNNMTDLRIR